MKTKNTSRKKMNTRKEIKLRESCEGGRRRESRIQMRIAVNKRMMRMMKKKMMRMKRKMRIVRIVIEIKRIQRTWKIQKMGETLQKSRWYMSLNLNNLKKEKKRGQTKK